MAQRSFWIVSPTGKVTGIIGSISWARDYVKKCGAGFEGPFEKRKDALKVGDSRKTAPPAQWTPETARRRVGGTYGT